MTTRRGTTTHDARTLLWPQASSLKEANRRKVIRAVMVAPGIQTSLARLTRLSPATVSGVVSELQQEQIVKVGGRRDSGKHVQLGSVRGVAVGVEVNHNGITVAARRVDASDEEYASASFSTDQGGSTWFDQSATLIKEVTARTGLSEEHIVSIGVGLPAAVDPRTGMVTQVASGLDWDLSENVMDRYDARFPGVPIIVDNEANYAAYAEYLYGAGQNREISLFVKTSTGIGAGLVIGGLIYRGRHGLGGELGHLTMDPLGIVCRCGSRGCLETLVGGARLVEQVRQAYAGYQTDLPTSLEAVIERAKGNDPVCRRVLTDAARNIGLALARVCNLLDPDVVVLGGELGRVSDMLIDPATEGLRRYALRGMFESNPIELVGSQLGMRAGARGALAFALMVDRTVVP